MAQVNGLLDWIQTPAGIGLLSAVAGGMAGAQRGTPWNNVGRGLVTGVAGYQGAQDQLRQESENALTRQMRQMQMQQIQQQMEQQKAQQAWKAGLPGVMSKTKDVTAPFQADDPFDEGIGAGLSNIVGQAPDMQARQEYLMAPGSPVADKMLERYLPKAPKWVVAERYNESSGMPEKVLMDENNPADVRPFGGAQADTVVMDNLGGQAVYRGSRSATPLGVVNRTASPDAVLSDQRAARGQAITLRGQNLTDARAREANGAGKPPAGYRFNAAGNLEAIPGGPADIKAGEAGDKRAKQKESYIAQAKNMLGTIKEAKNLVGYSTAGLGGTMRALPMTRARDLDAKLTTIKANLGFDRLQQMRDSSPTGGALGQVAVQELTALQATVASLDQLQSPEQLKQALDKIETHYSNWQKTLQPDKQQAPAGDVKFLGFEDQ